MDSSSGKKASARRDRWDILRDDDGMLDVLPNIFADAELRELGPSMLSSCRSIFCSGMASGRTNIVVIVLL